MEPDIDDDMEPEYDFSNGARGKFHSPGARLHIPIYLDWELQEKLQSLARAGGKELDEFVEEILRSQLSNLEQSEVT